MIRRLFTIASVLSMLLCVATLVTWIHDRDDMASRELILALPGNSNYCAIFFQSRLILANLTPRLAREKWSITCATDHTWSLGLYCFVISETRQPIRPRIGGFGFAAFGGRPPDELFSGGSILMIPAWALVTLFAAAPVTAICRTIRRHGRQRAGRCGACGYDLRASQDRCPECGTPIAPKFEAAT